MTKSDANFIDDLKLLNSNIEGIEFLRGAVDFLNSRPEFRNDNKNPIQLLKEYVVETDFIII